MTLPAFSALRKQSLQGLFVWSVHQTGVTVTTVREALRQKHLMLSKLLNLLDHLGVDSAQLRYRLELDWKRVRRPVTLGSAATFVTLLTGLLTFSETGRNDEKWILRRWLNLNAGAIPQTVTIVKLDSPSYQMVGLGPGDRYPRAKLAEAFEKIAASGAKLIIPDMFFEAKMDEAGDARLAHAIANTPLVLGRRWDIVTGVDPSGKKTIEEIHPEILDVFQKSAKDVVPLMQSQDSAERIGQISILTSKGFEVPLLKPLREFVSKDIETPGHEDYIRYYGPPGSLTSVSLAKLFGPEPISPAYFKDRVVWVGVQSNISMGLAGKDSFPTTFSDEFMFGIEIQATITANLLAGDWIRRPNPAFETVFLFLGAFFLPVAAVALKLRRGAPLLIGATALYFLTSYQLFARANLLLPGASLFLRALPAFLILWAILAAAPLIRRGITRSFAKRVQ